MTNSDSQSFVLIYFKSIKNSLYFYSNSTMKDKYNSSTKRQKAGAGKVNNKHNKNKRIGVYKQKSKTGKSASRHKQKDNIIDNDNELQSSLPSDEQDYNEDLMFEQGNKGNKNQKTIVEQQKLLSYESPQDTKIRLAKQLISNVEKTRKKHDDFFKFEQQQQQLEQQRKVEKGVNLELRQNIRRKEEVYASLAQDQQLKEQYFRSRNKLYKEYKVSNFKDSQSLQGLENSIQYKGHTKCITGIYLTKDNIYSCSKDRSIIKWDREMNKKHFISLGKDINHHSGQILSLDFCQGSNILATAGQDWLIKLWDIRNFELISTLKSHRNSVNGVKFGSGNSQNICSVSSDRTFKQWDIKQRSLMQTFYGHNQQVLDLDSLNKNDFISSGNDRSIVVWKTEKQTQMIFEGHDYAIDRVRAINEEKFITASQDGSVNLWSQKRKKPIYKYSKAHQDGWIGAMDNIKQSNLFATGGIKRIKLWAIAAKGQQGKSINLDLIKEIAVQGIVTDIKMDNQFLAAAVCDQHRLGRWITQKCRNKIKVFKFTQPLTA